jgi:mannose-6-phosphate isomerase-like protein (cupin superfamily)
MSKGKISYSRDVKPFVCDASYSSKMLLDDFVAGTEAINVNEGTLKGGGRTGGATHDENEIYYVVKGEAQLHLDEEVFQIGPGCLVFIPAGVFHSLENASETEEFVLLTLWQRASSNEVWHLRLKAWGKSFKTIDEE